MEEDISDLKTNAPDELPFMNMFPKNTDRCQDWGTNCSYCNLCKGWSNPRIQETPAGFVDDEWKPFDVLKLANIGLEDETEKENLR